MDVDKATETPFRERKVVRRGLMAGLAGIGAAALLKLTGAEKAEAHDIDDVGLGLSNGTPTTTTAITANVPAGPGFTVINGGSIATGRSGIVGVTDAAGGGGVRGFNNNAAGFGTGGDSTVGIGVQGTSTSGTGVQGSSNAVSAGPGVRGVGQSNGTGVRGVSNAVNDLVGDGTGSGDGVLGKSNSGTGVHGITQTGKGVFGASGITGGGIGVDAQTGSASGYGLRAANYGDGTGILGTSDHGVLTHTGDGNGIGVHGKSTAGNGVKGESSSASGVLGTSVSQPGVEGVSMGSLGVRGTSTNFVGVVGISTNSHGLYGYSTSPNGVGLVGDNQGGGLAGLFQGSVMITGGLQVAGAKNAIIKMQDGTTAAVYCQESPEPYFEDFGRAQLTGGVANVPLEREFAQLVAGGDYMVFPVPEGETRGLFVSRRNANGFEVREVQGGTGNVPFTYRIVTKRKDIDGRRFARVNDTVAKSVAATRASLIAPGPALPNSGQPGGTQPGSAPFGRSGP